MATLLVITKDGLDKAASTPEAFQRIWQGRGYYIYEGDLAALSVPEDAPGTVLAYNEITEDTVVAGAAVTMYNFPLIVDHKDLHPFTVEFDALVQNTTANQTTTIQFTRNQPYSLSGAFVPIGESLVIPNGDNGAAQKVHHEFEQFLQPDLYVYQLIVSRTGGAGTSYLKGGTLKTRMKAVQG